jgi:hypothetical protein
MGNKFVELCHAFEGIGRLAEARTWTPLSKWPLVQAALREYVRIHCKMLPLGYDDAYRRLLLDKMPDVTAKLINLYDSRLYEQVGPTRAFSDTILHADSLIGATTAWSDPTTLGQTKQFAAVVSDLFESFVTKSHCLLGGLGLTSKLPPLVTFATEPARGPATLNADVVKSYCGADISIVSQPALYAKHPILWGILAHEAGGHAVTHAVPGLADDLAHILSQSRVTSDGAGLWENWMEEAAADVYGLLNIGPSFAIGLGAWLKMSKRPPRIDTSVRFVAGTPEDDHPVDLLRLHVLKGATKALTNLDKSKEVWLDAIEVTIGSAASNVSCIDFFYTDPLSPVQRPLKDLGKDAELVGAALVTTKLKSLNGHAIGEIETWDEDDEGIALAVKRAAKHHHPLAVESADDAHLIAGVTMALSEDASLYERLNHDLAKAFADSYARDPKISQLRDVR